MERVLLLVDDEENIVRSLVRLLRRDGYRILTASSGREGLALLEENDVGVIISDQRMPEMNGVEFLSRVKASHPETVRMVLSGYTDLQSVTDAINEGAIYKFLTKPWDDEIIRKLIAEAFRHFELEQENERLTRELGETNNELNRVNAELEQHVRRKSRYVDINLKTLQVAQEVLDNLPMGILGIHEDTIVLANLKAHEILSPPTAMLLGATVQQSFSHEILAAYQQLCDANEAVKTMVALENGMQVEMLISKMGRDSSSQGNILILTPEGETT